MARIKKAKMIVGLQWGDEGKGAEIDRRSLKADLIVRCMGGNNAGHTTVYNGESLVLHLLPSAVASGKQIGIGAGVIVNPLSLINEIRYVQTFGLNPVPLLSLDRRCGLVMVYHRVMDMAKELVRSRGGKVIGTTARGIGPTYSDIADRSAIRISDLLGDVTRLIKMVETQLQQKTQILEGMGLTNDEWNQIFEQLTKKEITANSRLLEKRIIREDDLDYRRFKSRDEKIGFNSEEIGLACVAAAQIISNWQIAYPGDVTDLVHQMIIRGKSVMIEGAQGALLDNYFGTYPFVTSSHTIAGGACVGLGIGPGLIGEVRGIAKAYTTRVGSGPFPTAMPDELAKAIRGDGSAIGDEFGASTGRPRDCGWFDAVVVRTGCRLSGVTKVTITKLDKLSGLESIRIGCDWQLRSRTFPFVPTDIELLNDPDFTPIYVECRGWQQDISQARSWDDLPQAAKYYVETLEDLVNHGAIRPIKIDRIGVGPAPGQFIDL